MKYKEITTKNKEGLLKLLAEDKKKIQDIQFKKAVGNAKNTNEISILKKDVARILTCLNNTK